MKRRNNKKGKALKCYACGKLGHMAKDCRSKNKVHRQQLNTLDRDWNVIKPEDPPGEAQLSLKQWDDYNQILEAAHQLATSGGKDLPELTGQDKGQEPLTTSDGD